MASVTWHRATLDATPEPGDGSTLGASLFAACGLHDAASRREQCRTITTYLKNTAFSFLVEILYATFYRIVEPRLRGRDAAEAVIGHHPELGAGVGD